ncbi:MAG: hypothetical protein HC810_00140 [Acaryochloridaceae cyanobacterium RL_2_7]|nr:hypothetical protein [Acaryochloridaceae cyanobacterium RL_2_7]
MGQYERLILLAEDQLTQYSTDARKREKLRQKIGLSVTPADQRSVKEQLETELAHNFFYEMVENQRQAAALPFWGIAGLGLLFGISMMQPLDFIGTVVGGAIAISIQRLGWSLEAKRLLLNTLLEIEERQKQPN